MVRETMQAQRQRPLAHLQVVEIDAVGLHCAGLEISHHPSRGPSVIARDGRQPLVVCQSPGKAAGFSKVVADGNCLNQESQDFRIFRIDVSILSILIGLTQLGRTPSP